MNEFSCTLILRKPLAFIGRTLKKYIKSLLKYHTLMKTHFNYVFIRIKRLVSDAFVHANSWLLFSDNVNFQNLKDAIAVAQLETNGMSF